MSLSPMTFDKVWTNPSHFPTYEANETQVRADMQYLFDKIKDCYNNHLENEFAAANMPFTPTIGGVTSTDVQAAIEFVHNEISSASQGAVPNGSITDEKLRQTAGSEAVITAAMRDACVTTPKLNNGAVTFVKTTGIQKQHTLVGPVDVAASAWNTSTKTVAVTVTGASASNTNQIIDWTPANRASWDVMRDCNVWCVPTVVADNQVVLQCDTVPSAPISLYFGIWD